MPQAMEVWLDREANRDEWRRLATALELAEGFVFLPVHVGDELAQTHLGALLTGFAASEGLTVCDIELRAESSVAQLLDRLREATRPALFWVHRGDGRSRLEELLMLLNQKREVVSTLADAPLVMAMHPQDWEQFRRHAPDFWSIHQTVSRLSPGRWRLASRDLLDPFGDTPRTRSSAGPVSGWRVTAEELAGRAPARFFGRESEISFLVSTLGSPGARILISGQAGTGKTTLLSAAVARVADYFPDGIWWVPFNLNEAGPDDRSFVILQRLVGALASSAARSRDIDELGSVFRSVTASMEALFVFEDVDDLGALERLVPGARSSMLVTTRIPAEPGFLGDVIVLTGLGVEAGAALLQARTILDAATARRVASAAGSRPAMLTLLATILADEPEAALAVVERLTDDMHAGGAKLDAVLDAGASRVLAGCTARAQAAWPKLGLFHERFDSHDAAAVLGADAGERAGAVLNELARVGLIEPLASADEYRFFALLQRFAERQLDGREDAVATRLAYARRVLLDRSSLDAGMDVHAATDWLGAHYRSASSEARDVIRAIAAEVAARWLKSKSADAVMNFLIGVFDAEGDARGLASVYAWFGSVCLERGSASDAERWYQSALEVSEGLGDPAMIASAYTGLGDTARGAGDSELALQRYQRALDIGQQTLDATQLSALYLEMGDTARDRFDHAAAESYYRAALDAARVDDDRGHMAASMRGLAELAYKNGRLDDAEKLAHEAVDLVKSVEPRGAALAYRLLGRVEEQRSAIQEATRWYEMALSVFAEVGARDDVAATHFVLGELAFDSGDMNAAKVRFERALESWSELEDLHWAMLSCFRLGQVAESRGALTEAEALYLRVLGLAQELHDEGNRGLAYLRLGGLAATQGDVEQAMEYWIRVMREISVKWRSELLIEQAVIELYAAAGDDAKPIIQRRWEEAGQEWPIEIEPDETGKH